MGTIASYPVPQALDGSEMIAAFKDGQQVAIPPAMLNLGGAGTPGLTAYQLWLQAGNTGTLQDFLNSLKPDLTAAQLADLLSSALAILATLLPDISNGGAMPGPGEPYLNGRILCFAPNQ